MDARKRIQRFAAAGDEVETRIDASFFRKAEQLEEWLNARGVKTDEWGVERPTRPVDALLDELTNGEASLRLHGASPFIVLRVVNVRVVSNDERRVLVETRRELPDGSVDHERRPMGFVGLCTGDRIEWAVARGVTKELSVIDEGSVTAVFETRRTYTSTRCNRAAFPGLACRFEVDELDAIVPEGKLPQGRFTTTQARTTRHWAWHPRLRLTTVLGGQLRAHDFSALVASQLHGYYEGSCDWALNAVREWLITPVASPLCLVLGEAGTGKSVLVAELLHRAFDNVAAWHLCRHDDAARSAPVALLRSIAAMLCHTLDGFEEALSRVEDLDEALASEEPRSVFDTLIAAPLCRVPPPDATRLVLIDGIDELHPDGQQALLRMISTQLAQLPPWLRMLVSARDEERIVHDGLREFAPRVLRTDEPRARAQLDEVLRRSAQRHMICTPRPAENGPAENSFLAMHAARAVGGAFSSGGGPARLAALLHEPLTRARAVYSSARAAVEALPSFGALCEIAEHRGDMRQATSTFQAVYAHAQQAHALLASAIASEWTANDESASHALSTRHALGGALMQTWTERADDHGMPNEERARHLMRVEHGGRAERMVDLVHFSLRFTRPTTLAVGTRSLHRLGLRVVGVTNTFAHPTPLGAASMRIIAAATLSDGTEHMCTLDLELHSMSAAHVDAQLILDPMLVQLREMGHAWGLSTAQVERLESFIMRRLHSSAIDGAVSAISEHAEGRFLYAHLLELHLAAEERAGRRKSCFDTGALPAGIGALYEATLTRAFPRGDDDAGWHASKPLIELIVAAIEPISVPMAEALLNWCPATKARVLKVTALLFPVRDGTFHAIHRSLVQWMAGGASGGRSSSAFAVSRHDGHAFMADCFEVWLEERLEVRQTGAAADAVDGYWGRHGVAHLGHLGRAEKAHEAVDGVALELDRQRS